MRGPDEFSGHAAARPRYVRASDLVGSRDRQGRKRVLLVHGADVALGGLRGEGGPHPAAEHSKDEERSRRLPGADPHGKTLVPILYPLHITTIFQKFSRLSLSAPFFLIDDPTRPTTRLPPAAARPAAPGVPMRARTGRSGRELDARRHDARHQRRCV